jgi:hypothetical protein
MKESDLKDSSATPTRRFQRILDRIIDAKSEEQTVLDPRHATGAGRCVPRIAAMPPETSGDSFSISCA